MLIQNYVRFNHSKMTDDDDITFHGIENIERSKLQFDCLSSAIKLFAMAGFKCIKHIPVVLYNGDFDYPVVQRTVGRKWLRYAYLFSDGRLNILWTRAGSYFVYNTHEERRAATVIAKIMTKMHNTMPKAPKQTPRSIVDAFKTWMGSHLVNEDTAQKIISEVAPFIATHKKRKDLGVNMNLSLIFCGRPGDGKTYFSMALARWVESHLRIPTVEGEEVTFNKAAKAAPDFVAVIDDMNISHFQRTGPNAAYCSNILSEMDRAGCNRMFMLTTNEVITRENVDKAFFRPGRVQAIVEFNRPDKSVKQKFIERISLDNTLNSLNISNNFLKGVEHFLMEDEFSLAEMFRMKNLIYSDCVIYDCLKSVNHYVENCRQLVVPTTSETSYLEDC